MTTYEMILEEGRQEGRKEGIILGREELLWKVTLQMLRNGYDADVIQSVLQVDQKVIDQANLQLKQQNENRFWF
jgi:predicted transposase YdaD